MGCFLACFGGDEDRKRRRRRRSNRSLPPQRNERYIPRRRSPSPKRLAWEAVDSELSLREQPEREEPLCESPSKELLKEEDGDLVRKLSVGEKPEHDGPPSETPLKKSPSEEIAGDLILEPREESKHGTPLPESSPKELAVVVADDSVSALREKSDQEGSTGSRKKVTFDLNVITYEAASGYDELMDSLDDEKEEEKEIRTASSPCAYPLNHRYQDCASSDDEDVIDDEEEDYGDSDIDEEDGDEVGFHVGIEENEEESYESFFSLPLEKAEVNNSVEVNSPSLVVLANRSARDRSRYVHSVLNPVENLSKWKEVKDGDAPPKNSMKENANSEPTIKTRTPAVRASRNHSTQHEVSVDTSLSTWLVAPEKTQLEVNGGSHSIRSASSLSREEQPILGALTVEDIKQSSVTSSPRRSPSRNPDDTPIVGTVGSYWNSNSIDDSSATSRLRSVTKGIPNSTSKYREDKKVSWHSSPFEERLERALKEGSATDSCSLLPSAAVC